MKVDTAREAVGGSRDVVVLVDEAGSSLGTSAKLDAHEPPGKLHLAFSVVLFRVDGTVLIQQRAKSKYHFPLFWANACCSHPAPEESILSSATRRVDEELGVTAELRPAGSFVYRAVCPRSGLVEHELDHVFYGVLDSAVELRPDPEEVAETRFVDWQQLRRGELGLELTPWLVRAVELAEVKRRGEFTPTA